MFLSSSIQGILSWEAVVGNKNLYKKTQLFKKIAVPFIF